MDEARAEGWPSEGWVEDGRPLLENSAQRLEDAGLDALPSEGYNEDGWPEDAMPGEFFGDFVAGVV